jgi:hypothetical protein
MNPQTQQQKPASKYKWPEITGGMIVGFVVGLAMASMIAGFISWMALNLRQKELAGEYGLQIAVIVTEPIAAGEPVTPEKLAQRPLPGVVVTANAVQPSEIDSLFGKGPAIRFEKGDVLLRSAFGLPPRPDAPPEPAKE